MKREQKTKIRRAAGMTLSLVAATTLFAAAAQPSQAAAGYSFVNNGASVKMGDKAATFIKKAGKVKSGPKKVSSCAYKGYDITRIYKNFKLVTYTNSKKKNATEYVQQITFLNKKAKTKEGIHIGSTKSAVLKAYKKAKVNKTGILYTATKGKTKLLIQMSGKGANSKVKKVMYIKK